MADGLKIFEIHVIGCISIYCEVVLEKYVKNCASPLERGFRGSRLPTAELEMEFRHVSSFSACLPNYGTPQTHMSQRNNAL